MNEFCVNTSESVKLQVQYNLLPLAVESESEDMAVWGAAVAVDVDVDGPTAIERAQIFRKPWPTIYNPPTLLSMTSLSTREVETRNCALFEDLMFVTVISETWYQSTRDCIMYKSNQKCPQSY